MCEWGESKNILTRRSKKDEASNHTVLGERSEIDMQGQGDIADNMPHVVKL